MAKPAVALLVFGMLLPTVEAGLIRGTVVEKRTGYSLSRAVVTLQPVGAPGQPGRTARSNESGQFTFANVAAGAWLIRATRRGFLPMEYGQRRWNSAGTAIIIDSDEPVTVRLPLSRYSAITGTVRDSNEVGIPDQDVAAYSDTQPPHFMTRTKTDDRGVFRIPGLEPGTYFVRTTGNEDEDRAYLPTFSRQTLRVEDARPVVVYLDEDSSDGDIRPIAGRLFDLSGSIALPFSQWGFSLTVTLASDMGRVTGSSPFFHFGSLAPGRYEIYAEARENPPGNRILGAYAEVPVERNLTYFPLPMNEVRESQFVLEGAGTTVSTTGFVRRKDLAGVGPTQPLMLTPVSRFPLFPGRWEFLATPPAGYYVSRFGASPNNTARPEGWNEIQANNFSRFTITFSNGPGGLHGTVSSSNAPAGGAPVFLETWDPVTRKRLLDLRETRTDMRGNYRFEGLSPGDYRVVSTYEYAAPDPGFLDAAQARAIRIESSTNPQVDLELYGIP